MKPGAYLHAFGIINDVPKYYIVSVTTLDPAALRQASDLICIPLIKNLYNCFKSKLIECPTDLEDKKLHRSLPVIGLEDLVSS